MACLLFAIFIQSLLCLVTSESLFDDQCSLTDHYLSNFDNKDILYFSISNDCNNGTVYWNYPQGTAVLNARRPGQQFELCILSSYTTTFDKVEVNVGKADGPVSIPLDDATTCIHSINGEAAFTLQAPTPMRYMTIFDYLIRLNAQ
uniref:Uncharacterized protein n=1 Tax=Biomphalaria glabrata TaxID=6526 RepID=A0A2C9L4A0_BIOGL